MASPQWPAPTTTVVAWRTASDDGDRDGGGVGEDVVDGRALLRLRDDRLDLLGPGLGVDAVLDPHAAEAVADVRVGAEDAVQVHVRGHARLHRAQLDPPLLRHRRAARG